MANNVEEIKEETTVETEEVIEETAETEETVETKPNKKEKAKKIGGIVLKVAGGAAIIGGIALGIYTWAKGSKKDDESEDNLIEERDDLYDNVDDAYDAYKESVEAEETVEA